VILPPLVFPGSTIVLSPLAEKFKNFLILSLLRLYLNRLIPG
jgi:hypothetical protein